MHNAIAAMCITAGGTLLLILVLGFFCWLADGLRARRIAQRRRSDIDRWLQEYDSAPSPWRWPDLDDDTSVPLCHPRSSTARFAAKRASDPRIVK